MVHHYLWNMDGRVYLESGYMCSQDHTQKPTFKYALEKGYVIEIPGHVIHERLQDYVDIQRGIRRENESLTVQEFRGR